MLAAASTEVALAFIELGAITLGLAILARVSGRFGLSPIPAYLLAGLAFGEGGLVAPAFTEERGPRPLPRAAAISRPLPFPRIAARSITAASSRMLPGQS